ncbi:hypothetical protein [Stenoxybacter acetivorans]|uniref:hypothetical protein n=1 Tax=Stenoxybacter acetivorans TaxID=422441 RepID=UPI0012EBBB88|nr:hypothetical protein [Stenoxybacter acetivorans]
MQNEIDYNQLLKQAILKVYTPPTELPANPNWKQDFNELLEDQEVLDVFIRLRDK